MPLSAQMLHSPLYTLACLEVGPLCSSRALSMGMGCSFAWLCVRLTAALGRAGPHRLLAKAAVLSAAEPGLTAEQYVAV